MTELRTHEDMVIVGPRFEAVKPVPARHQSRAELLSIGPNKGRSSRAV